MFVLALRRLRRYFFVHLSSNFPLRVLTRFAAHFLSQPFFRLISFIFSYVEIFFVVFFLSFYFILALRNSACDMNRPFLPASHLIEFLLAMSY